MARRLAHHRPGSEALLLLLISVSPLLAAAAPSVKLSVDAGDAPQRIFHARLTLPASPGPFTFLYPKWLPGEHGPTGPITDLAGLRVTAAGKEISWRRDPLDMYVFHCEIPQGASTVEIELDYLGTSDTEGFTSGASASAKLALISWNQMLVYPQGVSPADLMYEASLRLPAGWQHASALKTASESGGRIRFAPVSLVTLVDSPLLAGAHLRAIPLGKSGGPRVEAAIAADSEAALEAPPDWIDSMERLVAEAEALFGGHHFGSYRFLISLSDHVAHFGLEHHESSDNRTWERALIDKEPRLLSAGLLPHELVHSWNGKHRRPAGLNKDDLHQPVRSDMLWIYEGLTSYLGDVLSARSGLRSPQQYREKLALIAAGMEHQAGRVWRPLVDTAVAAQRLFAARDEWSAWRRGVDFYDEGALIWLEADVTIRRQTQGRRSLDDFCRLFFGGPSGPPGVKLYGFDDVVTALNETAPRDWRAFLDQRLSTTKPRAPLGGIEGSGWRLVYKETKPVHLEADEEMNKTIDLCFSLGLKLKKDDGRIVDVIPGLPAALAGIGPGMKLLAVDGRRWSADVLRDRLEESKGSRARIELLVENGDFIKTHAIDYRGGERYPHLERDEGRDDLLEKIISPLKSP